MASLIVDLDGAVIGQITLTREAGYLRQAAGKGELGYLFLAKAWGCGYAVEACAAALDWFAGALPGEPVVLATQTADVRSMRLAAKQRQRHPTRRSSARTRCRGHPCAYREQGPGRTGPRRTWTVPAGAWGIAAESTYGTGHQAHAGSSGLHAREHPVLGACRRRGHRFAAVLVFAAARHLDEMVACPRC